MNNLDIVHVDKLSGAKSDLEFRSAARPRKILFVIAHLGAGGAQRVAVNAANALVERGFDVHVIELLNREHAYELDSRVIRHRRGGKAKGKDSLDWLGETVKREDTPAFLLGPRTAIGATLQFSKRLTRLVTGRSDILKRVRWLRKMMRNIEPDAVLSFLTQTNIFVVLATRGMKKRVVISERNDPRLQRHRPRVEFLRRMVYPLADVVTANSKGALSSLAAFVPEHKLAFLPNPVVDASDGPGMHFAGPTIVTVGRLVEQKGIDVLLAAWAKAVKSLPGWRLALIGDGPLADELKAYAEHLHIQDSVDWIGHVSDPFPYLRGAEFFVMTSRFEGTPNALLEAMVCGLPAVISDASPGPCELVGSGEDAAGLIVPVEDSAATGDAMVKLATDEHLRRRLAAAARERVRLNDAEHAIGVWLKLLGCE